jgi:hypothetical protein
MRSRFKRFAVLAAALAALLLSACATRLDLPTRDSGLRLRVQSSVIAPGNGGELIAADALAPGDILLTSIATVNSFGIRLGTFSPVSHAVLYLGDGQIAEAVGTGVRARPLAEVVDEEQMVVAFRVPGVDEEGAARLREWAMSQVGTRYNTVGVLLNAPFVLNRRLCELPLVPRGEHFCMSGMAMVQLGASRNDQFFCSQFVLEAYKPGRPADHQCRPALGEPGRPAAHARRRRALDCRHATAALRRAPEVQPAAVAGGRRALSRGMLERSAASAADVAQFDVVVIGAGAAGLVLRRRGGPARAQGAAGRPQREGGREDPHLGRRPRQLHQPRPRRARAAAPLHRRQPEFLPLGAVALRAAAVHRAGAKARHRLPREAQGAAVLRRLLAADRRHAAGRMRGGRGRALAALQAREDRLFRGERRWTGAGHYRIESTRGPVETPKIVVATGGLSIPQIGASDFGYRIAQQFGLRVVTPRPALVPLTFGGDAWAPYAELAGWRCRCGSRPARRRKGWPSSKTCCSPTAASRARRCCRFRATGSPAPR